MLLKGWVAAGWGVTAGTAVRVCMWTKGGHKQLEAELSQFQRVNRAIIRVIQTA
jgi:PadR family transcriptional regulator PadR